MTWWYDTDIGLVCTQPKCIYQINCWAELVQEFSLKCICFCAYISHKHNLHLNVGPGGGGGIPIFFRLSFRHFLDGVKEEFNKEENIYFRAEKKIKTKTRNLITLAPVLEKISSLFDFLAEITCTYGALVIIALGGAGGTV